MHGSNAQVSLQIWMNRWFPTCRSATWWFQHEYYFPWFVENLVSWSLGSSLKLHNDLASCNSTIRNYIGITRRSMLYSCHNPLPALNHEEVLGSSTGGIPGVSWSSGSLRQFDVNKSRHMYPCPWWQVFHSDWGRRVAELTKLECSRPGFGHSETPMT